MATKVEHAPPSRRLQRPAVAVPCLIGAAVTMLLIAFAGGYGTTGTSCTSWPPAHHMELSDQGPVTPLIAHLMNLVARDR